MILKTNHKNYNLQHKTHSCAYGVAVQGLGDDKSLIYHPYFNIILKLNDSQVHTRNLTSIAQTIPEIYLMNMQKLSGQQTALWSLRDWQFPPIAEVAIRSPIGPGKVAKKSATSRGPRCDQFSRS